MECLFCKIINGEIPCYKLYEDDKIECFLAGNPRAEGHTIISTKKHYKDMMEIPDDLCIEVFTFAKKAMSVIPFFFGRLLKKKTL